MIRCVVFDFDGTLVLSNEIKHECFLEVASTISGGYRSMELILLRQPGDREQIFKEFSSEMSLNAADLVAVYSRTCEEKILQCAERAGASRCLNALKGNGISIYVNSATPLEPLRKIIDLRFGSGFFNGVYGGHGAKVANLSNILAVEVISPKEIVMIGDGTDDLNAAEIIGCQFMGISNGTLAKSGYEGELVEDLDFLLPKLLNGCEHDQSE